MIDNNNLSINNKLSHSKQIVEFNLMLQKKLIEKSANPNLL